MSATDVVVSARGDKPVVVMIAFPLPGHTQGTVEMSDYLVSRGYTVYHIGGSAFREQIQRGGAEYVENDYDLLPGLQSAEGMTGPHATIAPLKKLFMDIAPKAYRLLKDTLEMVKQRHPLREVVIWHECMAGGLLPFYYGAPLPKGYDKLPRVVNFQSSINTDQSDYVFPFGYGRPPVSNEEQRFQCVEAWKDFTAFFSPVTDYANSIYKTLGATEQMTENIFCRIMNIGEVTIFPYSASLEFPRPDLRFNARFVGTFDKPVKPGQTLPSWWSDIETNRALPDGSSLKKKLIFVSQGTAHLDYSHLLMPALTALGKRVDFITVAALGAKEAKLPDQFRIPINARVIDYLPYENILEHTDVFVSNAGFGGFLHGVTSAVPMVMAGTEADKADVCQRAVYAGMAISLNRSTPTEEAIADAVDKILANPKYKSRAAALKRENENLRGFETAEKYILGIPE